MFNFSQDCKIVLALAAAVAGTSSLVSSIIDTEGYDGVCFITTIDTLATGNIAKLQSGALSGGSDQADVAASHVVATTTPTQLFIDCVRPPGRYVTLDIARGTSTAVGEVYAILYLAKNQPINNVTGNFAGVFLNGPLNGTA